MKLTSSKLIYSCFILVLYLLLGVLMLLKYLVWEETPNFSMGGFGLVVIIYGIFRGYRAFHEYKKSKENNDGHV